MFRIQERFKPTIPDCPAFRRSRFFVNTTGAIGFREIHSDRFSLKRAIDASSCLVLAGELAAQIKAGVRAALLRGTEHLSERQQLMMHDYLHQPVAAESYNSRFHLQLFSLALHTSRPARLVVGPGPMSSLTLVLSLKTRFGGLKTRSGLMTSAPVLRRA